MKGTQIHKHNTLTAHNRHAHTRSTPRTCAFAEHSHAVTLTSCSYSSYLKALEHRFGIQTTRDWYKVSSLDVVKAGGGTLLKNYGGSLMSLLEGTCLS